jgi:acyl carrier protein
MEKEEIVKELKLILKSDKFSAFRNYIVSINDDTSLLKDIAMDSIQILEFIVDMEKKFSFSCEHDELNLDIFNKFENLVSFIQKKISVKQEKKKSKVLK